MDEKSDDALSSVDSEAMLTAGLANSESFAAGSESLTDDGVDSFKSFITSPAADTEALVDTLISDSTVTSKDEEAPSLDNQELTEAAKEVAETPTSSAETVTTTSDEVITTSDGQAASKDTTVSTSVDVDQTAEIATSTSKVEAETSVSESSTITLNGGQVLESETAVASDAEALKEDSVHIESKPDMLSKALEAMETETVNVSVADVEPASEPDHVQTEPVDVKDEEVPVLRVSEDPVINDSNTSMEWKSKDDTMCDLEEELKRMHEGDTPEPEAIIESSLSLHPAVTMARKEPTTSSVNGPTNVFPKVTKIVQIEEDKPIMKDSDLEEMLAADVILKDAGLIQRK